MKKNKDTLRECLIELYEQLTMMAMKEFEASGGEFESRIIVIDEATRIWIVPFIANKEQVYAVVDQILKENAGLAVISLVDVETVKEPGSQNHKIRNSEWFIASLESRLIRRTKIWEIKRDEKGNVIFPLGDAISGYYGTRFTDYFKDPDETAFVN